ncbi:MAG: OmpA family protein [Fibrobacterota bacterium]
MIRTILLFALTALLAGSMLSACASRKAVKRSDGSADTAAAPVKSDAGGLQPVSRNDMTNEELAQVRKVLDELQDVPFDFDSYTIPTEGVDIIKKDVAILNDMLKSRGKYVRVAIEGHTDERGSAEYNLALGERRAKTVKDYLLNVGFFEQSLHLLSFGEERPKVQGAGSEAWAANRRVHFVVE